MSNAARKTVGVPTRGVLITDPSFVAEYDEDGIIINDPDCLPTPADAPWVRAGTLRKIRGMPLADFRQMFGVSQSDIADFDVSKIESGEGSITELKKYAAAMGAEIHISIAKNGGEWRVKI